RPVIALRFGLLNPIPETIPAIDRDELRQILMSHEVTRIANAKRKEGAQPPLPSSPTAVKVTDKDLQDVSKLQHLQELDLSYGEITKETLEHIKALRHLQVLDLGHTPIDDAGLQMLEGLTSLKKLYLTSCPVTNHGLAHLRKLTNLEVLVLGGLK